MENKQKICDLLCTTLRETRLCSGDNPLVDLKYMQLDGGVEIVRPLFKDGTGSNGYYDVNVSCDSGAALVMDIATQFISRRL